MTKDEENSFVKAMKDPEFRALLNEYMLEISDPQNRAEQEMYLRQLERENQVPSDKQLVLPTAGFVLKVKHKGKKMFVNVCTSDEIQPPSSTRVEQCARANAGTSWNLPYCVGPHRMEQDKGGLAVMTFDVCYHPQTLTQAKQSAAFLKMLVNTTLDGVDLALSKIEPNEAKVSREYHILKGIAYKSGDPITMVITTSKLNESSSSSKPSQPPKATAKPDSKPATIPKKEPVPQASKESKTKCTNKAADASMKKPTISFQIVQRGQFDIADHMENGEKKLFRPRELLVKIDFPNQTSASGIDLDVSSKQVKVAAKDYSPCCIDLPFPVVEAKGSAKFDKATRKLIVTLPVVEEVKPTQKVFSPVKDTVNEEENKTTEISPPKTDLLIQSNTKSEKKIDKPKQPVPADEFAPFREFALMSTHDKPKITYKSPKVLVQETASHISYIVQVNEIIGESVSAMEENDNTTRLTFQASDTSWYEYEFTHTGISEWNHDLATSNMAIICTKLNSRSSSTKANDDVHDIPHRVQHDTSTISIIVDVANVDVSTLQSTFTSSLLSITFETKARAKYHFQKTFDQALNPDTCQVANVADDNFLIVLTLQQDTAIQQDTTKDIQDDKVTISKETKAAIINRFTNDVMYELD
ncbi:hypothetical protein THRCLA_08383 [Thraustotheca clavata]|uniref:PIH1 domain-containing protein 1 n=1 Tax=Thraustotheca clavata TaxID=74557 RepID=A0A1V9Z6W0_9STRA|nr:hypothetical protein THRCLA_08383 [Thraustotheca clavata]